MLNNTKVQIVDISWHNIYLSLTLSSNAQDSYEYEITDLKGNTYPLDMKEHKIVINIVNFPQIHVLHSGKWYITYKNEESVNLVGLTSKCGYKLEHLNKVYRYGAQKYAYIITFSIQEEGKLLETETTEDSMVLCMQTSYMMINKREDGRNLLVESSSLKQWIRKVMFVFAKSMIQCAYLLLSNFRKKDGKHILLMSETRVPISGNLKALDDRLKERHLDEVFTISYSFSKTLQQSKWKTLFTWSRLLWLITKQDYIFVDDYVPIFKTITLRKETKLIQLWHAGVGFKSVGYARFGKAGSPHVVDSCHRKYDYAVVGAEGLIPVYEEVFGITKEHFLPYGLPRLDGYLDEHKIQDYKDKFYKEHPELKNKEIIMFAPTYRGSTQKEAYYPFEKLDLKALYEVLGENRVFIFKMHPFIVEKVEIPKEYQDRIYDFSQGYDINELFYVTDILITDFSSNIYEFALQHKPMIFYAYDKDFYQLTRGVHRTLDQAPGVVCETFDELLNTLKNQEYSIDKLEAFIQESFNNKTKLASDCIIDDILLKQKEMTS